MRINKQWIIGVLVLGLAGCYYDNEEELYPKPPPTNIPDTSTAVVSYKATIAPMMTSNCTSCHSTNGGTSPDLTTYQGVFNNRGAVQAQAVPDNAAMPQGSGPMSAADRSSLDKWIKAGAPNN